MMQKEDEEKKNNPTNKINPSNYCDDDRKMKRFHCYY